MSYFTKDGLKVLQGERDSEQKTLLGLEARIKAAEAEANEAKAATKALGPDASEAQLTAAETKELATTKRVSTLIDMRDKQPDGQKAKLVALDRKISQEIEKRTRAATANDGDGRSARIAEIIGRAIGIHIELEDALSSNVFFSPEDAGFAAWSKVVHTELLPEMGKVSARNSQAMIAAIRAGNAPASIPQPLALVETPKPAPEEPRTTLFALQNLRYSQNGKEILVARYDLARDLSDAQAQCALELKVACDLSDERIPDLRKRQVTQITQAHHCWDLDTGEAPIGPTILDLPSRAPKYTLPPSFAPTNATDVQLPRVAARKTEDDKHE